MILTSHSGEDKDAIALADLAKQQQVPLIVITGAPASRLAKMADAAFVAVAEESRYRTEALHALIAELSLMDTLFMISAIQTNSQTLRPFAEFAPPLMRRADNQSSAAYVTLSIQKRHLRIHASGVVLDRKYF